MYNREQYKSDALDNIAYIIETKGISRKDAENAYNSGAILDEIYNLSDENVKKLAIQIQHEVNEMKVSVNDIMETIKDTVPLRDEMINRLDYIFKSEAISYDVRQDIKECFLEKCKYKSSIVVDKNGKVTDIKNITLDFSKENIHQIFDEIEEIIYLMSTFRYNNKRPLWVRYNENASI